MESKKCKCPVCRRQFEESIGLECVKNCGSIIYCSAKCRSSDFKKHMNTCNSQIIPKKKDETKEKNFDENNNNQTFEKTVETLEEISGISELCTGCRKEKSILTCCENAEYCCQACANNDWERHKHDCRNVDYISKEELTRLQLIVSKMMQHMTDILRIYSKNMNPTGYGLVLVMETLMADKGNIESEEDLISIEQLFESQFKLLHETHLKRIQKKLNSLGIPKEKRPLQIFVICPFGEVVRTFRMSLDRTIISLFYHGGAISVPKLKTMLNTIEQTDFINDKKLLEILYSKECQIAWKLFKKADIKTTAEDKKSLETKEEKK